MKFESNYEFFHSWNAFEDVFCEMAPILFRGRWDNYVHNCETNNSEIDFLHFVQLNHKNANNGNRYINPLGTWRRLHVSLIWVIIGSDNGLSPVWHQTIIWSTYFQLGASFSETLIAIQIFSFTKIHLKIFPATLRPCCYVIKPGCDVIMTYLYINPTDTRRNNDNDNAITTSKRHHSVVLTK